MYKSKFTFFKIKLIKLLEEYERWRRVSKELKLSREARLRLDWIIYYYEGNTAIQTARHYGVSKKTFYKWFAQFDRDNLYSLYCLEDKSKDPKRVHWNGLKRYIFTAVDKYGKVAYARMYKNKSSKNGEDFLYRLYYLLDGQIPRVGHDNGTEFEKYFKSACQKLQIEQYYSRVQTLKDNPNDERFNRTLQEEFIQLGNFHSDPEVFNRKLTEWLIEYNFHRPHQALNYQTPLEFSKKLPICCNFITKITESA